MLKKTRSIPVIEANYIIDPITGKKETVFSLSNAARKLDTTFNTLSPVVRRKGLGFVGKTLSSRGGEKEQRYLKQQDLDVLRDIIGSPGRPKKK
jgi:hypothetical protein